MSRYSLIYVAPDGSRREYVTAAESESAAVVDAFRAIPDAVSVWVARRLGWS